MKSKHTYLLIFSLFSLLSAVTCWTSGQQLNVYVVPHSHNDPGWWNTFEDYYTSWTRGILNSIMEVLSEDQARTFIWAEISFFQRWWDEQSSSTKDLARRLVENKQLEFVTGGWVMNDEANCHMIDIINQLTQGHEWLYKNLNTKPTIGWAIDPFGHSPTMAYVLQAMGFKGMVINRIHRDKKADFRNSRRLEFHWIGEDNNTGPNFNMLTHVFPWKLYDIPNTCGPDWDVCAKFDFERDVSIPVTSYNLEERSKLLLSMYRKKAELFPHNHVLIPLGDDFKYKTPDMTRKIMSQYKLMIDYINKDKSLNTNIRFTTLSTYFQALQEWEDSEARLPIYKGDFFTYCDEDEDYWAGYFTTRPFMKGMTRTTQSVLRTGELMYVLEHAHSGGVNEGNKGWIKAIETARSNLGIFQHHDGVTGTARVKVVQDYARRLHESLWGVASAASSMALSILKKTKDNALPDNPSSSISFVWSHTAAGPTLTPAPRVLPTKLGGDACVVVVFNSLQHYRNEVVSVYIAISNVKVSNTDGQQINVQVEPVWVDGNAAVDRFNLYFVAGVPALGFTTFFVYGVEESPMLTRATVKEYSGDSSVGDTPFLTDWVVDKNSLAALSDIKIVNRQYSVIFGKEGNIRELRRVVDAEEFISIAIKQEFLSYSTHRSGAYLFLPNGPAGDPQTPSSVRVVEGPIVKSVTITLRSAAVKEYAVRLYDCAVSGPSGKSNNCDMSDMVEIMHTLDMRANFNNKEVITRYTTNIENNNIFYTDSNGIDMRKRKYSATSPIQANYYPITSAAYIEDSINNRLTILSHQAHGVGSLATGSLEVMLDRRLNQDDFRGLGEHISDNVQTVIPLWLLLEQTPTPAIAALTPTAHAVWQTRNYPLQQLYTENPIASVESYVADHHLVLRTLHNALPNSVQVLTMAPRNEQSNDVLMRLYSPMSTLTTPKNNINLDIFENFVPVDTKDVSLSMMYEVESSIDPTYSIRASEIKTFLFILQRQERALAPDPVGAGKQMLGPSEDTVEVVVEVDKNKYVGKPTTKGGMANPVNSAPLKGGEISDGGENTQKNNLPGQPNKPNQGGNGIWPPSKTIEKAENRGGVNPRDIEKITAGGVDKAKPVTSNLYTMSATVYACMIVGLLVGIWVCRQKTKRASFFFSWNKYTEGEASVMKLL